MMTNHSIPNSEPRFTNQTQPKKCCLTTKTITHPNAILLFVIFICGFSPALAQQSKIDSLLNVIQMTKVDTIKVNSLYKLSYAICDTIPVDAIRYAKQGILISNTLKFEQGIVKCNKVIGISYSNIGKFDSAKYYLESQIITITKLGNEKLLADTYFQLSIICDHLGERELVPDYLNKAEEIYMRLKDKKGSALIYFQMGVMSKDEIQYEKSLGLYFKALNIFESLNDKRYIAQTLLQISQLYFALKQYEKSEQFALKSIAIFKEINDYNGIESALYIMSRIYRKQGDFEKSINRLSEAKILAKKYNDLYMLININTGLALNYREMGQYNKALEYFNIALTTANIVKDMDLLASIYEGIFTVLGDKADYKNALSYLRKSEEIFKTNKTLNRLKSAYYNYVYVFTYLNQPDSVAKYFDKYEQLTDSIYSEQTSKAIAEMQTKYETEKKDKEILALNLETQKKKNAVWAVSSGAVLLLVISLSGFAVFRNRKKKEQAILMQTISETDIKALRAQMNPHFIFNCIHTVDSLLDDHKIQESKDCLIQFATLTRSVLENSNKREIPLVDELKVLSSYMELENTRLSIPFVYKIEIASGLNSDVTLIPPLILQPFVENAIKHGFEKINRTGQIKIGIQKENDWLVCTVEDNGSGRNTDKVNKLGAGFKKESMGIKLSEDRLRLLGEMKNTRSYFTIKDLVDNNNNPAGTRVKMYLPFEQSI